MNQWPTVPLGEVLDHRKEFIEINDLEHYKRCRVQLHAQGVVLRDNVPGAEIKTKKQQVCKAGEFLVAEIDAKLGGYGIVPAELDGAIVSSHYFLFGIREERLDRSFLGYFIRTPGFFEQVADKVRRTMRPFGLATFLSTRFHSHHCPSSGVWWNGSTPWSQRLERRRIFVTVLQMNLPHS